MIGIGRSGDDNRIIRSPKEELSGEFAQVDRKMLRSIRLLALEGSVKQQSLIRMRIKGRLEVELRKMTT